MNAQDDEDLIAIHIVDDDPAQIEELAACLEPGSPVVHRHRSGTELLDAIYAGDGPCIVIADMQMPDVSGWGVAASVQKLRARGRSIGLLIVTGYPEQIPVRRALMLQIDDMLEKPVVVDDLLDSLERLKRSILNPQTSSYLTGKMSSMGGMTAAFFHLFEFCDRRLPGSVRSETHLRMILYCTSRYLGGRPVSVSSVCYASGAPLSTAMRKLQDLVDLELFSKSEDVSDRRRVTILPTNNLLERLRDIVQVPQVPNVSDLPDTADRQPLNSGVGVRES